MIVVADTTPLNYLVLIGLTDILPRLFGSVIVPTAVHREMLASQSPSPVRDWAANLPSWVEVRTAASANQTFAKRLGAGEREALELASAYRPDSLLLIDDLRGREEAARLGLPLTGTLGILLRAHERKILRLHDALDRLEGTSFQVDPALLQKFRDLAK